MVVLEYRKSTQAKHEIDMMQLMCRLEEGRILHDNLEEPSEEERTALEDAAYILQKMMVDFPWLDKILSKLKQQVSLYNCKAKKFNNIFFQSTARVIFNPPASKFFIAFPVFTLKNRLYIANCHFRLAVICCLFVCWLAGVHNKSGKCFWKLLGCIVL